MPTLCASDEESLQHYLEGSWWAMHHSHSPENTAALVTCYLDESGTDIEDSKAAVVAGLLLNESQFVALGVEWAKMLARHKVAGPLHMREFGKDGRLGYLSLDKRRNLISDAVSIINACKIYSIAATLTAAEYERHYSALLGQRRKKAFSMYATCFMLAAMINFRAAEANQYSGRIAYSLDRGNNYKRHVLAAYDVMIKHQESQQFMNLGSLTFDSDEHLIPLQAADVIAWATRRRLQEGRYRDGFQPLVRLFDINHQQYEMESHWMAETAANLKAYLAD